MRAYVRDTADLIAIGDIGRAVWWELIRKADRAGLIDHGGEPDVVMPDLLRVRPEWWTEAWPKIARRGMACDTGDAIFIPNHVEANEAKSSDRQRQRESRARRRDKAAAMSRNVTSCDASQIVTPCDNIRDGSVTNRDDVSPVQSRNVTVSSHRVTPSLAEPSLAERETSAPHRPESEEGQIRRAAAELWTRQVDAARLLRADGLTDGLPLLATDPGVAELQRRLRERSFGATPARPLGLAVGECEAVLQVAEAEARRDRSLRWFDVGIWTRKRFDNLARRVGARPEGSSGPSQDDLTGVADRIRGELESAGGQASADEIRNALKLGTDET